MARGAVPGSQPTAKAGSVPRGAGESSEIARPDAARAEKQRLGRGFWRPFEVGGAALT